MTSSIAIKLIATFALVAGVSASFSQNPAPVAVADPWVRATVPGQSGTGAFMTLTARVPLRLVGIDTPVAEVAEVHEMKLEGQVMKMRAVPALPLPAGEPVQLRPGGFHVMLMDLKRPLAGGGQVPLVLRFEDAQGAPLTLAIQAPVRAAAGATPAAAPHKH